MKSYEVHFCFDFGKFIKNRNWLQPILMLDSSTILSACCITGFSTATLFSITWATNTWVTIWNKSEITGSIPGWTHFPFSPYYLPTAKQLKSNIYNIWNKLILIIKIFNFCIIYNVSYFYMQSWQTSHSSSRISYTTHYGHSNGVFTKFCHICDFTFLNCLCNGRHYDIVTCNW